MIRIMRGDCRDRLRVLPDESVHCVVTSPPYFGLRDYGTAQWEGGDPNCDHKKVSPGTASIGKSTLGPNRDGVSGQAANGHQQEGFRSECGKCGARRIDSQIGLEQTPQDYVEQMVAVFREVRRVLRKDGTVWLNLGDSYAGGGHGGGGSYESERNWRNGSGRADGIVDGRGQRNRDGLGRVTGLKPKDLIGIPWRVAFALQADGWWLRQDIIWAKPNPMPESVTDRCTKAHEYIFLLSKSAKYYYDAEAIKEPSIYPDDNRKARQSADDYRDRAVDDKIATINPNGATTYPNRNKRSVWEIATQPFSEAHFATFPPALIEPCILAGCPKGGAVLDSFAGAGTTGLVADRLGRDAILMELNPDYASMAECRLADDAGMFANINAE